MKICVGFRLFLTFALLQDVTTYITMYTRTEKKRTTTNYMNTQSMETTQSCIQLSCLCPLKRFSKVLS